MTDLKSTIKELDDKKAKALEEAEKLDEEKEKAVKEYFATRLKDLVKEAKEYGYLLKHSLDKPGKGEARKEKTKRTRLTGDEQKKRNQEMVIQFKSKEKTHKQLEEDYGLSYQSVHKILTAAGVKFEKGKKSDA